MNTDKRPAFQFYPGDWRRDTALQSCSIAARGLWIEMLCVMHDAEPYGYLRVGSKTIDDKTLARMVGVSVKETASLITELELAGVLSRDESGVVYSRRLVKDAARRKANRDNGLKGGNPKLLSDGLTHAISDPQQCADAEGSLSGSEEKEPENQDRKKHSFSVAAAFADFWTLLLSTHVPKPVKKQISARRFAAKVHSEDDMSRLLVARERYVASDRVARGKIQDASTWLLEWEDWETFSEPVQKGTAASPVTVPSPAAETRTPEQQLADYEAQQAKERELNREWYRANRPEIESLPTPPDRVYRTANGMVTVSEWQRMEREFGGEV